MAKAALMSGSDKQSAQCRCKVTEECFGHMTAMLQPIAPMAVLLEGGYNLSATAASTEACLRVLLGQRPAALPFEDRAPSAAGLAVIQQVIRTQVSLACGNAKVATSCCSFNDASFGIVAPVSKFLFGSDTSLCNEITMQKYCRCRSSSALQMLNDLGVQYFHGSGTGT